ncbi:PucR family transcriptional regulator [Pseudonocardia broussonetiae]|uniref:Helix-turn-helix domain-containing protein n=1 Tax=Pseudonocardia broussonetiae TaxID=2736640 RepID=A0A6M6JGQ1_9PSEU|nr:helix-turn-helix domain-containing protein [Pseudonocardia broussonetiae]QJY46097.1 helix-turn-helix domain-containing protein [Pseudonocardia broussonetiae]
MTDTHPATDDAAGPVDGGGVSALGDAGLLLAEHAEEFVGRQVTALHERFSVYRPGTRIVPESCLTSSARRNVRRAATTLREGRAPTPDEVDEAWVGRERAEQGMVAGDMMDGYRLAHRVIRDGFIELCRAEGVATPTVLEAACLLWETADAGASQVFHVRRDFELARVRLEQERAAEFLLGLLRGTTDPEHHRELVSAFGLVPEQEYLAVCALPTGGTSAEALRLQILSSSRRHGRPGLAVVDGEEVVGIVPRPPVLEDLPAVVGLGRRAPMAGIAASFQVARRVRRAAGRFGSVGVFTPDDLGLRVAIVEENGLGAMLVERYFGPLRAGGHVGSQLEETVRAYLDHGRNSVRTARVLGVHPNTLRYRLRRFEEVVAADLENPRCLAELWWACEVARLVPDDGDAADGSDRPL